MLRIDVLLKFTYDAPHTLLTRLIVCKELRAPNKTSTNSRPVTQGLKPSKKMIKRQKSRHNFCRKPRPMGMSEI